MSEPYDRWITFRHLWCCLLCQQLCAGRACGMCHDKWESLS